jgi:hypothetical protein
MKVRAWTPVTSPCWRAPRLSSESVGDISLITTLHAARNAIHEGARFVSSRFGPAAIPFLRDRAAKPLVVARQPRTNNREEIEIAKK